MVTKICFSNYVDKTDNDLVQMYHSGDQDAATALLIRYVSLVNAKASGLSLRGVDSDDFKQEAYIGLFNAIRTFDEHKGATFCTYAYKCMDNRLKNLLISSSTTKAKTYDKSISYDEMDDCKVQQNDKTNPEDLFIQNEEYLNLLYEITFTLSKFEKDVLFSYLSGNAYELIAKLLHSSTKSVDNALQRARRKLKAVFEKI
ncbi:MAG: sigma-70 family RNA polymerase sigma factor [Oscillospiraceae bacterium]